MPPGRPGHTVLNVTPLAYSADQVDKYLLIDVNPYQEAMLHVAIAAAYLRRVSKVNLVGMRWLLRAWRDLLHLNYVKGFSDEYNRDNFEITRDGKLVISDVVTFDPTEKVTVPTLWHKRRKSRPYDKDVD
jgi:hypothetical protein